MRGKAEGSVLRPDSSGSAAGRRRENELAPGSGRFMQPSVSKAYRTQNDFSGPVSPHDTDALDYAEFLRTIWRHKFLFIISAAMATAIATAFIAQLPSHYVAHALVVLGDSSEASRSNRDNAPILPPDTGAVQTAVEVLLSPQLAAEVIRDLSLEHHPEFNRIVAEREESGVIAQLRSAVSEIKSLAFGEPEDSYLNNTTAALPQAVKGFLARLRVSIKNNSRMIDVAFDSRDPQLAMRVANTLVDHYVERQLELRSQSAKRTSDWLRERIAQLEAKVADAESAVEAFRSKHGLFSMPGGSPLLLKQMTDVSAELATAETDRAAIEARLRQFRASLELAGRTRTTGDVVDSPLMEILQTEEAKAQQQLAEMSTEYGDKYPPAVALREKIRNIHSAMRRESLRVVAMIENDLHVARMKEQDLRQRLGNLQADVSRMNGADVTLRALERTAQADRRVLDDFMARLTTTSQNADTSWQKPDAQIASYAQLPVAPERPRKGLLILVSGLASLIGAALLAHLVERSDRSIRNLEEIEAQIRIAGLGLLPISAAARLSPSQAARYGSAYREALKEVYANLFSTRDAPRVVVITSAIPGEGKSTLALSLAALAAQCGNRVLLVDADFWKWGASEVLGIRVGAGLAEVLENKASLSEVIISDIVSGADVLLPGRFSRGSLLAWMRRLPELLVVLKDQYEIVIIDAPPVLSASEALLIAQHADATVMAVRWSGTPRDTIAMAAKKIRRSGAMLIGSVITMINEREHANSGYSEGSYFSSERESYPSPPARAIAWASMNDESGLRVLEGPQAGTGVRRHALLVVDVQECESSSAEHSQARQTRRRLVETINRVSEMAIGSGVMVLYSYRSSSRRSSGNSPAHRNAWSAGDTIVSDVRSEPSLRRVSEHIFDRRDLDAFSNSRLNRFLRDNQIEHLFIVGLDGTTSISDTAHSALGRGYRVTFIQDGIVSSSERKWKHLLHRFESHAAFAITKEEFADFCHRLRKTTHSE